MPFDTTLSLAPAALVEQLHREARLSALNTRTLARLRADLNRVAADSDVTRIAFEDYNVDEFGSVPPLRVDYDPHLYALRMLSTRINGVDPSLIRAAQHSSAPFHYRKLAAVTAPARLLAARKTVDGETCPDAFKALCFAAKGLRWADVGRRLGWSDKAAKTRVMLALSALRRHYASEDKRPVFAVWGAVEATGLPGTRFLSTPGWRLTPDGREIVERCATKFMSLRRSLAIGAVPFLKLADGPLSVQWERHAAVAVARSHGNILRATVIQRQRQQVRDILTATELWRQHGLALDRAGREKLERDLRADAIGGRLPVINGAAMSLACERQTFVAQCRVLPSPGLAARISDHKKVSNGINGVTSEKSPTKCYTENRGGQSVVALCPANLSPSCLALFTAFRGMTVSFNPPLSDNARL
jgi:hypothetical protein